MSKFAMHNNLSGPTGKDPTVRLSGNILGNKSFIELQKL